jgi:protein-tyrosine phosphatase
MIDLHHHCLPDVDDGPREWDEAVAMCHAAAEEGIETIVATPHVLRGRWKTFGIPELESRIAELRKRVGETPRLLLGSEYFFAHDVLDVLNAGNAIVPLAGSRYVLFELAANSVPPMIEQPFYRMQLEGWVPVLAHPERNFVFHTRPDVLAELLDHGVKTQITTGSLTGEFGAQARRAAETFLRRNLVHFVATDAHNMTKRPPRIREAKAIVEELVEADVADALLVRNPRAVIENGALDYDPEPIPRPRADF